MKSKKHITALEKRQEKIRQNNGQPLFYVKKVGQPSLSYGKEDANKTLLPEESYRCLNEDDFHVV